MRVALAVVSDGIFDMRKMLEVVIKSVAGDNHLRSVIRPRVQMAPVERLEEGDRDRLCLADVRGRKWE